MKNLARPFTHMTQRLVLALVAFLCSAISAAAWADPPGRVGRLGETTGQVWLYTPDGGEWISAERNRPLTSGDRLATDANARADVRIGSTTVRLDGGTELEVLRIDDDAIALQLHNGSTAVRFRDAEAAREFELRTAEGRFLVHRPGRYRFDRGDETSHVTVWSGEALYEGPGSALTVNANQRAEFWLEGGNSAQYSITEPQRDDFSAWAGDRDRSEDRSSATTRYVSPEMTGAEDLDRYGQWQQAPEYGAVWVPRYVPYGWAPYNAGHWAWVSPWGWTWVDDQPWGFAPFHYGRWAMYRNRWCWVPGTYVRRPVYAPALVGWIGGPQLSVSIRIGGRSSPGVGWFPLAPREVYVPTYRVSPGYVQQVNVTHVTNITNVTTIINNPQQAVTNINYRNRRFPHAVTVVPQTVMVNRQPVAPVAAQWRNNAAVQQVINQPQQKVVVSAPPVAAPVITPAIAQARRMHIHGNDAARSVVTQSVAPSPVAVPTSPSRQSRGVAPSGTAAPGATVTTTAPQAAPAAVARPQAVAPPPATNAVPPPPSRMRATPQAEVRAPVAAPSPVAPPAAAVAPPVQQPHAVPPPPQVRNVPPPQQVRNVPPPPVQPATVPHPTPAPHPAPPQVASPPPAAVAPPTQVRPPQPQVDPRQKPQQQEQRRQETRAPVPQPQAQQARAPMPQPQPQQARAPMPQPQHAQGDNKQRAHDERQARDEQRGDPRGRQQAN